MERIILFDGECTFCNQSVQFIINRDPQGLFKFASQQSDTGKSLLSKYRVPCEVDSIVLIEGTHFYLHSTASLRISKHLKGLWKMTFVFMVVPRPLRDWTYEVFSKNRYKWFGKQEACHLPSLEMRKRFL